MSILATFIGIDKHADLQIRDLTGACRDATALWALFADNLSDTEPHLLVDADATVEAIRGVLADTLAAAGPDDTVILGFSGHGTRDHRLVAHDTTLVNLVNTTIPMNELADLFTQSQARAILCILDCCFSGGAPARVVENSPVPRDIGFPVETLAGKGRVLITASNVDQPAWELPGTGHGLLTRALLDVLQAAEGTIGLPAAMDQVMERVRAEAARIGVDQTPVLFGHVEGGLNLPALRPGARFYAAFPETAGQRVGHNLQDLSVFGLPDAVLTEWADRFHTGLNDLQVAAVNDHRILDGASLLVVAPTSSGKTFIGELAATRAIVQGRKAVFLLPYRALVNEKFDQFSALYGDRLGMRVIRCTGDYLDQTAAFVRGKYDLALLTYEMFLSLAVGNNGLLHQIGLVVIDEAQFVTDPNRGITVELLLTYLITARERGVEPQIIALSAVIGDINDFDRWLGCDRLVTTKRPVRLVEGVLDRSGTYQYLDETGQVHEEQLLPWGAVHQRRDKPGAQDVIVPLVRQLLASDDDAKVIVFRNQRGSAQGCANYLAQDLGLPSAADVLDSLPQQDLSSSSTALHGCLEGGTAFHTANLTREERLAVEHAFREPTGKVRVLAATTTVAAGINTPASAVVLAEQEFVGEDGRAFTVAEYKNMAGRAGRLGFNEEGRSIILADNAYERRTLFDRYVTGQLEPFRSSFNARDLETWVVRLLAQIDRVPRNDVPRLLANTYGGYVANRNHPGWRAEIEQRAAALIVRMEELGLIEQDDENLRLSLLGRACGSAALSFASAMSLVDLLRRIDPAELTAEKLLALIQAVPESDGGYTPMMKKGTSEAVRQRQAVDRFGAATIQHLQRNAKDTIDYYARCKRAALLWDWVHGVSVDEIERLYTTTPYQGRIGMGDVRKFADSTRFHLRSAHQIASVMLMGQGPDEAEIEVLLKQLEVGLPDDALTLLEIPFPLARGEYLALYQAGIRRPDEVWALEADALVALLGPSRAARIEQSRPAGVDAAP